LDKFKHIDIKFLQDLKYHILFKSVHFYLVIHKLKMMTTFGPQWIHASDW